MKRIALILLASLCAPSMAQTPPNFWELGGGWNETPRFVGPMVSSFDLYIRQDPEPDVIVTQFRLVWSRLDGGGLQEFLEVQNAASWTPNPDGSITYRFTVPRKGQKGSYRLRVAACFNYLCGEERDSQFSPITIDGVTHPGWSIERRVIP